MKIILLKTLILFLTISFLDVSVYADINDDMYVKATNAVNEYIAKSIELGQREWEGFNVSDSHELYDNMLDQYGYAFELNSNASPGYAIVTCDTESCSVIEASYDSPSPYIDCNKNNKYIYTSALEYYVAEPVSTFSTTVTFKNAETGEAANLRGDIRYRTVNSSVNSHIQRSSPSYEGVHYVDNYATQFEAINQSTGYNCVATSMAMCLNYLKNRGRITFNNLNENSEFGGTTIVEKVRGTITDYYNGNTTGSDSIVRPAINKFGEDHCNPKIYTKDNGFWGNSVTTDITFNTIMTEIGDNCPLVMMFNPGCVLSGINMNHATACFGYKRAYYSNSTIKDYTIVKVPQNLSNNANVVTKEILWCYQNVHGYYLVYIC